MHVTCGNVTFFTFGVFIASVNKVNCLVKNNEDISKKIS